MTRPLLPFLVLLLAAPAPRDPLLFLGPLAPLFERAGDEIYPSSAIRELPGVAVDLTSGQIGDLALLLRDGTEGQRFLAALALYYAGEPAAAAVLLERSSEDPQMLGFAVAALATVESEESRELLESVMIKPANEPWWWANEAAAVALGVRRDPRSITVLDEVASDGVDGFTSFAADVARRWIREGEAMTLFEESTAELEVIAAILRSGLPETFDSDHFYDPEHPRLWRRHNGAWWIEPTQSKPERTPYLGFDVHVSPESGRAIVSVVISRGGICANGWDYVMRHRDGEWKVVGALRMWIS